MPASIASETATTGLPARPGLPARAVLAAIRAYQLVLSPVIPPSCRFVPSCSEYAHQAVARHGVVRGIWLGARRLARCHPLHPGGYDPVERP